jgi:phosphate transport system permease protein
MAVVADDIPTRPAAPPTGGDRVYVWVATAAASVSFVIVTLTAYFLVDQSRDALHKAGVWRFFSTSVWNPTVGRFGVLGLVEGTMIIALIGMIVAVPAGVAMALFINEYAPAWLRKPLTSMIDLLAALPSLLFGMWGFFELQHQLVHVSRFFADHLAVIPFLRIDDGSGLPSSSFIAGVVVGIMILPILTSVSRDVMAQVPREQCEGALALGGTRSAMVRSVILPFARKGITGGAMLGFGRALGETIAVALIIVPSIRVNTHVLQSGGGSIAAHIATRFGEASPLERSGLAAAGLALFMLTLVVNLTARAIVRKSVYSAS